MKTTRLQTFILSDRRQIKMSLQTAIEVLKPHLTRELQVAIVQAMETVTSDSELSVPYFAIFHMSWFAGMKHTIERRLTDCPNVIKEKCLRDRLALMNESSAAGTTQHLWGGYIVNGEERNCFMVDEKRKVCAIGPFP